MSRGVGSVSAVVERALGVRPARVTRLGGGCVAEVARADLPDRASVVVKLDPDATGALPVEAFMLRRLARCTALPVPAVLASAPDALVMEYIEGSTGASGAAEAHAATLLASLHDISADSFGFERDTVIGGLPQPNDRSDSWVEFFAERRLRPMARLAHEAGRLPADARKRLDRLADQLDRWIDEPPAPALIHGDVWAGNVLSAGGRVTAFLDPALAFADAELELAFITLFSTFGRRFFDAYAQRRPIRDGFFEVRRDVYNIYPLLVHVRLFGGPYIDRLEATLGRFISHASLHGAPSATRALHRETITRRARRGSWAAMYDPAERGRREDGSASRAEVVMLAAADLEYDLPERLIATTPASPRDSARLMVVRRSSGAPPEHRVVADLPSLLSAGDTLVMNRTRVLRARLVGRREPGGGRVEGLFLEPAPGDGAGTWWRVLLRCNGRLRPGARVTLGRDEPTSVKLELIRRDGAAWLARVTPDEVDLERVGLTPLPPYILRARAARGEASDDDADRARYQTLFARPEPGDRADGAEPRGSVAAPTAGLHLTPALLARLASAGVGRAEVELRVGAGTFAPIRTELVDEHPMHAEWCAVPADTVRRLAEAPGRVIAVGTTSARTLESVPDPLAAWADDGWSGWTRLLITPGYRWKRVDGLLTNFHLPRSTLLAMVASLLPGGAKELLALYREAIREGYRFYSFGDAMLILP